MSVATIFDESYYLSNNADVVLAISRGNFASALQHYQLFGGKSELRDPNASFDASYYAAQNPDVLTAVSSGLIANVFTHYQMFGEAENRAPTAALASFDAAGYLAANADVQAAVTAGTIASALEHYIAFGASEGRDGAGITGGSTGEIFSLAENVDFLTGKSGDDTFLADNTTEAQLGAADSIDGGAGFDLLRIFYDNTGQPAIPAGVKNVEKLYMNGAGSTLSDIILSKNGFTAVELDGATTNNAGGDGNVTVTIADGLTLTLDSILDGSAGTEFGNSGGDIELAAAGSVTSATIILDDVGDSAAGADLDIDIQGSGVATLNVTSSGDTNYVGLRNTGTALKTLNISGDKLFDADDDALSDLTTIDASSSTGGVKVNVTGSTADVKATGGTGDDTFIIGADLDTKDTIDGGDGTDTVVVSGAILTSPSANVVKGANGLKNVEVLGTSATDSVKIDATKFSAINNLTNTAAITGTVATSVASGSGDDRNAAIDGINFIFGSSDDTIVIGANVTGGAGAAGQAASGDSEDETVGADALEVVASTNTGTDEVTISFAAGAATTLTGGAGENTASGGSGGETGGAAINASTVETINISTASASDDVTLTGGASGSAGINDGADISVGSNAKINLTGAGDVNLGTVNAASGEVGDDLTIDGSGMTGKLTVTTGVGNDSITGGSKGDAITAGSGVNTVTGGAGADTFNFAASASVASAFTSITDFVVGSGNDEIVFTDITVVFEEISSANATAIASDSSLSDAITQAFTQFAGAGDVEATAFVYGGAGYVVVDDNNDGAYNSATDQVVKLTGLTDVSGIDMTQVV